MSSDYIAVLTAVDC